MPPGSCGLVLHITWNWYLGYWAIWSNCQSGSGEVAELKYNMYHLIFLTKRFGSIHFHWHNLEQVYGCCIYPCFTPLTPCQAVWDRKHRSACLSQKDCLECFQPMICLRITIFHSLFHQKIINEVPLPSEVQCLFLTYFPTFLELEWKS